MGVSDMLEIAVCDDERFYREKIEKVLKEYLAEHELEYRIQLFPSGEEFLSRSENRVKYDIVFMDINMEKVDGIQAAMQMRSFHSDTYLVLVTAFINYVLEGYKVNAVRYIMKDTLDTAIAECMDAVMEKMKVARVSFSFVEGERKLSCFHFLRIHKSYLVNMKHIRRISNYTAVLDTGEELPVPRAKFQAAKEAFVAYKGAL